MMGSQGQSAPLCKFKIGSDIVYGTAAAVLSLGLLVGSAGAARAAVTMWTYELDSAWDLDSTTDSTGASCAVACGINSTAGTDNTLWSNPSSINWGAGPVSGITVGETDVTGTFGANSGPQTANGPDGPGTDTGVVVTGGPFVTTVQATHHNFAIPDESVHLRTTVLQDQLLLRPIAGTYIDEGDEILQYFLQVVFEETPNEPGNVDDLFGLPQVVGGNTLISQGFEYDGLPYVATLKVDGVVPLTDAECGLLGLPNGCHGLRTPEGASTSFNAQLAVTLVPIPPAGVLFFSALAGLGVIARRKKARVAAAAGA